MDHYPASCGHAIAVDYFLPSILQRERGWLGFSVAIVCFVLLCLLTPALPRSVPGVKALLALANASQRPNTSCWSGVQSQSRDGARSQY